MSKWVKDTSYVGDLGKLRGLEDYGMTSVVSHFDSGNEIIELCRTEYDNSCFFVKWNEEADKWELLERIPEEILRL